MQTAIKVIDLTKMNQLAIKRLYAEIDVMRSVDHPNIVKYKETVENDRHAYINMEFLNGGEILSKEFKSEEEAAI